MVTDLWSTKGDPRKSSRRVSSRKQLAAADFVCKIAKAVWQQRDHTDLILGSYSKDFPVANHIDHHRPPTDAQAIVEDA